MPWCRCGVLLVLCICPLTCFTRSPCPPGCCCSGFLVLCESLGLRSLPRSVPLSTALLSVARNQLCNVDHLLRPFSGLQELSLSHNLLARFPRGLPPSLESLLLQENRITYITAGSLRNLRNLTRLDLEDNRISAVQPGALQALERLKVLTLKGNRLTRLPVNLPPSLTHLDVSTNCISSLDLTSLSSLVNLQVLKINSNCLRSVPENTFDRLPRLRSVDLTNNRWVCECEILYLYRWLLDGRLRMKTDLVCTEPVHLAQHLLLNLSVMTICPTILSPESFTGNWTRLRSHQDDRSVSKVNDNVRVLPDTFSLQTLTYEDCISLASTPSPLHSRTTSELKEERSCLENSTRLQSNMTHSKGLQYILPTSRESSSPTANPGLFSHQDPLIVNLLATVFVLVLLLMLLVLVILKKLLRRQQRVAPLEGASAG